MPAFACTAVRCATPHLRWVQVRGRITGTHVQGCFTTEDTEITENPFLILCGLCVLRG